MQTCYTYDEPTKRLEVAKNYGTIDRAAVINPTREQSARMTPPAYPLADPMPPAPTPPEGKIAVPDGYEPADTPDGKEWRQVWRYEDIPAPTVADFDAAMEEHLRIEREARGYTTREPDVYLDSQVPRWAADARDWIAHRDAVMLYALEIMNAVEAGTREPPTLDEFKQGLPTIAWTEPETTETDETAGTEVG